jgi:hypothetical protein
MPLSSLVLREASLSWEVWGAMRRFDFTQLGSLDPNASLRDHAEDCVGSLEALHVEIIQHWADGAPGWAPPVATAILTRSRLDRQASLCECLRLWLDLPAEHGDGHLILAWANLGSLVEGTLKFFLSVFAQDYERNPKHRKGKPLDPDELEFEVLRTFFRENVWLASQHFWDPWLQCVQWRRNAIHAYRHREIGTHAEFLAAVVGYHQLAHDLSDQLPWWSGAE